MADEDEGQIGPRKGKSNAILTYEKIAEFGNTLTAAVTILQGLKEDFKIAAARQDGLEARVRLLELNQATTAAERNATTIVAASRKDDFRWGMTVAISIGTMLIGVMGTYIALTRAIHN